MFEATNPLALTLAPPIIVLVWWLHRFRNTQRVVPVSAAFLWRDLRPTTQAGARRARLDPIWILRAAIAALVIIALSRPIWSTPTPARIDVWFDDSLSLFTQEKNGTRVLLAVNELLGVLNDVDASGVTVRSLANHSRALQLDRQHAHRWRDDLVRWLTAPEGEPTPPSAIALHPERQQWLVTDGANENLIQWARRARLHRIIRVGDRTDNVGLTRLAARRTPDAGANEIEVLLEIYNSGSANTTRTLRVSADEAAYSSTAIRLDAGQLVRHTQRLALTSDSTLLHARLEPPDALMLDDQLQLDLSPLLRASVGVRGDCGPHLLKALRSHAGVAITDAGRQPQLIVACDDDDAAAGNDTHTLVVHESGQAVSPEQMPRWTAEADSLHELFLHPDWVRTATTPAPPAESTALLQAGNQVLMSLYDAPRRRLDVWMDLEHPTLVRQPVYPVLVAKLLDAAAGAALLDPTVSRSRPTLASDIAPKPMAALPPRSAPPGTVSTLELAPLFILAALCLLLVDSRSWLPWPRRKPRLEVTP